MEIWGNNFFSQQIMPAVYADRVAKKYINPKIKAIEETEEFDYPLGKLDDLTELLQRQIQDQLDRKKGLEDKIKSILFIISVSITAITFCLKDLNVTKDNLLSYFSLIFLLLSILHFVYGGVLALNSLIPIPFHNPQPAIKYQSKTVVFVATDNEVFIRELLKSKLLNDEINLKVHNITNSILKVLRNGMLLFAAFFIIAIVNKMTKPEMHAQVVQPTKIKYDTLNVTVVRLFDSINASNLSQNDTSQVGLKPNQALDSVKKADK